MPFAIDLFDHDDIVKLGEKPDLSDEVCLKEFVDFFLYDFMSFFTHLPFLLRYWFGLRAYGMFVTNYVGMDPQHVRWLPRKYICVSV